MADLSDSRAAVVAVINEVQNRAYPSWADGEYMLKAIEAAGYKVVCTTPAHEEEDASPAA